LGAQARVALMFTVSTFLNRSAMNVSGCCPNACWQTQHLHEIGWSGSSLDVAVLVAGGTR
jgi:sulfite reductase beta subunit-like hemoprotein